MVLHGKKRILFMRQSFDRLVIQIHMREFRPAFEGIDVDAEAMVLRGNFDLAGRQVHDWMIPAVVPKFEFIGAAAKR